MTEDNIADTAIEVDPVTLEVLRNGFESVAEEMSANLVRTSYSPNIKERKDASSAVFDADGRMLAQAENIPVHLGAMPYSVRSVVDALDLGPGDTAIHNSPFSGGAHLPDITFVSPVFVDGDLVAYVANRAHHADVGGARAGSVAADSTSIFGEGVQIPPVKLFAGGDPVPGVFDLLLENVRTPDEREGDLRAQQAAPAEMVEGESEQLFCPFEADWYARNKGSPIDFEAGIDGVLTSEEYLPAAVERGTCPHRAMGVLLESAEVVVANYNHLFDPDSRPLIESILGEDTFLVVDEAHRLEERTRDLLSDRVGRRTLTRARNDVETLLSRARESDDHEATLRAELESHDVPIGALRAARDFYAAVLDWLDDRVARFLDAEVGRDWRAGGELPDHDFELPLRDPEVVERDELTEWAEEAGYTGDLWRALPAIGMAVEGAIDALDLSRTPVAVPAGTILSRWWERDHAGYLREIELEHAPSEGEGWQGQYTAGLVCFECMPGETLRDVFGGLGGGILMSATLEPLDVIEEVVGLSALEGERPVVERTYDLPFPAENRASWLVDATPFTAHNRGDPEEQTDPDSWNRTRDEYAHVLRTLARSPGNVLLALPNYREAAWAGAYLESAVDCPVYVDGSSSFEATEDLKQSFFAEDDAVLVTSTRGTLTEGVDYDGDKLHTCAVVGVPLVNIGSPRIRAVRRAYGDAFGEDVAFEYALTVPAVRRARQAIGRVIRGTDEVGVRALVGRRYVPGERHSVHEYLSPGEQAEFVRMTPEFLPGQVESFWKTHGD